MAKLKLSVTLPPDLVVSIDRAARRMPGGSRSAVIERWLRAASRQEARLALARATVDYYESLSDEARAEDDEWTRFSTANVSWTDGAGTRAADGGATQAAGRRRRRRKKS